MNTLRAKWTIEILRTMQEEPVRLGQLRRLIPHATKKMLVETLRRMEATGLIRRIDLSRAVLHVEYSLEPNIKASTIALLDCLDEWHNSLRLGALSLDQQSSKSLKSQISMVEPIQKITRHRTLRIDQPQEIPRSK